MSRAILLLLIVALLSFLAAPVLRAEDDPVDPPAAVADQALRARVAAWLTDLVSDAFRVREAARVGLEREGLRARDLLEAAAQAEDPEVRRTVAVILSRSPGVTRAPPGAVSSGDFVALGRVRPDLQAVPLREALESLGACLGGHFRLPLALPERTVTLATKEVSCFAALAEVLKAGGLRMPDPFDSHGTARLLLSKGDERPVPQAFAGPLRIRVQEVAATRTFGPKAAPRYLVKLRLDWAPFVQVTQFQTARLEVARDPDGKPFLPSPAMRRGVTHGVSTRARSTTIDVHLLPGPEGCKPVLGALEISVPLTLRHDRATVTLDDTSRIPVVLGVSGQVVESGQEESVSFLSLNLDGQGGGQWIAEYAARLEREVAQRTLQAYVREASGHLSQLYVAGGRSRGADGTVRITARAYRGTKGKPKSLVVSWYRREERGELRFRLENIPLR